ncbi:MAG TPA: pyridoxal-phosphate dependent enzyme [Thermoanaerobaculia bacterium]|nr:pyridoxal-phosphate dependent enzyme [Thermoanaerobaculia bacterium]
MRHEEILEMVGKTPHLRVRRPEAPDCRLYMKLEGSNPTGSIKDRACVYLIRAMLEQGALQPHMRLLDASSGNMGCAVAFYGRLLGYATTVVANSKLTADKRGFILYYGAELQVVGDFTIDGNRRCRELAAAEPERFCFLDQLHNWANPRAHFETTAPEILDGFPELAMVVGSLGSGGSLVGTAQRIKQERPAVRIVAVQAAPGTRLPGTGAFADGDYLTPFIEQAYADRLFDLVISVRFEEAVARTLELRDQGIFGGLQTGGVLHATLAALPRLGVRGEVVMLSGDSGWKNMEKLLQLG